MRSDHHFHGIVGPQRHMDIVQLINTGSDNDDMHTHERALAAVTGNDLVTFDFRRVHPDNVKHTVNEICPRITQYFDWVSAGKLDDRGFLFRHYSSAILKMNN